MPASFSARRQATPVRWSSGAESSSSNSARVDGEGLAQRRQLGPLLPSVSVSFALRAAGEQLGDRGRVGLRQPVRLEEPLGDGPVEVVAAERRVAAGGLHLEHALDQLEDGDVEGAAAEVVDREECPGCPCPARRPAPPRSARSSSRSTSSPASRPASLVACRWASSKYAGTVMTACSTLPVKRGLRPALERAEDLRRTPRSASPAWPPATSNRTTGPPVAKR